MGCSEQHGGSGKFNARNEARAETMRCGQAAKMPDAVSVVRAATTPSAIAPFETTESGRELGQAEPLMAPWWKLADRTKQVSGSL
jgi:hypothetical protein